MRDEGNVECDIVVVQEFVSSLYTILYMRTINSQVQDVKSLALQVTSINLVSLERESIVE